MKNKVLLTIVGLAAGLLAANAQNATINGAKTYQTIHGLGINANPQSWAINPGAVKAVVDQLIDSMGCSSFRLMFDDCDWEQTNDNDDPKVYNWAYYDSVYSSPRFAGIWEMIRYLNSKGITDVGLSPDGAGPKWMGGTTLLQGKEQEYAEMMSSMVFYAKKKLQPALQISTLSPINESTCGGGEGVVTTPDQFGRLYADIAARLIADGISDVSIVGPDDCGGWLPNVQAMLASPVTMSKLAYFGQHDYGSGTQKARDLIKAIKASAYPSTQAVMTEVNAVCRDCDGGVYNKDYGFDAYAGIAYKTILDHLNAGVNGIQVWEAYDSRYHHPNRTLTWSMWGVFAVNDTSRPDVYTARTHFSVLKHLYRFVKPEFKRIDVASSQKELTLCAFTDGKGGSLCITGMNNSDKPIKLDAALQHLSGNSFAYYFSDQTHNFVQGRDVVATKGRLQQMIPPHSIFTLASH